MADTKISALPAASAVAGANEFAINEAAVSKKASATQLSAWMFEGRGLDVKKHFGAIGDGVVNDTTALQAAFDSGVPVYIPPGTYKVTATLTVSEHSNIMGAGFDAVIKGSSVTGPVVDIGSPSAYNISFTNLTISGTATTGLQVAGANLLIDRISLSDAPFGSTFTDGFKFVSIQTSILTNLWTNDATISGKDFSVGDGFNANFCANWHTSNISTYNFWMDATGGVTGGSTGNTFDNLTAQGGVTGLYIGELSASTFNGYYSENIVHPIVLGDQDAGVLANAITINAPIINGPDVSHPNFSSRMVGIDISNASSIMITSPRLGCSFGSATSAPVTFSGGGGSGAAAIALVTPSGVVSSVVVIYGGTGYTSNPTPAFGGLGSGATATAARTGNVVTSVTVTAGGSGYTSTTPAIRFRNSGKIVIVAPSISSGAALGSSILYPWVVRHTSAFSSAGITIVGDSVANDNGSIASADMIRAADFGNQHYLIWWTNAGVQTATPYVPPVYP